MKDCLDSLEAFEIIELKETASTNDFLRQKFFSSEKKEFIVAVTSFQTAGKGQKGNHWESEEGKNLLFSICIFPHFLKANRQFTLSKIITLAIKETLDSFVPDVTIKWPNDIYCGNKKICGILIENDLSGKCLERSVLGCGVNLNQVIFHSDAPNPVSLIQLTQKSVSPSDVLYQILKYFERNYRMLQKGLYLPIDERYKQALYRREGFYSYCDQNGFFKARLLDVDPDGRLMLCDDGGTVRRYGFKEVQFIINA